jgi:hypothetical protein
LSPSLVSLEALGADIDRERPRIVTVHKYEYILDIVRLIDDKGE